LWPRAGQVSTNFGRDATTARRPAVLPIEQVALLNSAGPSLAIGRVVRR
jgi:hypothetical protein